MKTLFTVLLIVWSKKVNIARCNEKKSNKKLAMTKEDDEFFENSTKCWICDNAYDDGDNHCDITGKFRGSAHRDCNIKVKWNRKFLSYFTN